VKCGNCRYEIRKDWNYCPKCGNRLGVIGRLNNFIKRVVQAHPGAKVKVRMVRRKKPGKRIKYDPSLKVVEPRIKKLRNKIVVELPGVKKAEQVHLRRAGNSIELNALTKKKRYFKILNLQGSKIIDKMFADGKLILVLSI
jgi:hypothetical protein